MLYEQDFLLIELPNVLCSFWIKLDSLGLWLNIFGYLNVIIANLLLPQCNENVISA